MENYFGVRKVKIHQILKLKFENQGQVTVFIIQPAGIIGPLIKGAVRLKRNIILQNQPNRESPVQIPTERFRDWVFVPRHRERQWRANGVETRTLLVRSPRGFIRSSRDLHIDKSTF